MSTENLLAHAADDLCLLSLFLRAHNRLIDEGYNFQEARELMQYRHQWIVVHEFLAEVLDPDVYDNVFRPDGSIHTRYYHPEEAAGAEMPVEFSVAAYRFGHSQVRKAYILSQSVPPALPVKVQVFDPSFGTVVKGAIVDDLRDGRPITSDHVIFWPNFLPVDGQAGTGQPVANVGRKIDTLLSSGLFLLPIPGAEPTGSAILAKRNLQRAREYGLPSGQAVAIRLNLDLPLNLQFHVYSNDEIIAAIPRLGVLSDPAYLNEAPLWLYILAESQIVHNGARLGSVGSRIVAETIGGLLATDSKSYYRKGWTPDGGAFRAQDLLREAGVLP